MSGLLLFLFISGGVGATAIVWWRFSRHSRLRPRPAAMSQPQGLQTAAGRLPARPENRSAGPKSAEAIASGSSGDKTAARATAPPATLVATSDSGEVLESTRWKSAEEPVSAERSADSEPSQDIELSPSDVLGGVHASTLVAAPGVLSEASGILHAPDAVNAEEAPRGADRLTEEPLAADKHGAQASEAVEPQPLRLETPILANTASANVPEARASGSAASAQDELLKRDTRSAEVCTGRMANETSLAAPGAGEIGTVLISPPADDADEPEAGFTTPTDELAPGNGEGQQLLPQSTAVLGIPPASESVAPVLTADAATQSGLPESLEASNLPSVPAARPRRSKPAEHRDRRGQRRAAQPQTVASKESPAAVAPMLRTPAEARLRLMLHPARRTVSLSLVLARPAGYPDRLTLLSGPETEVGAYSDGRYDDIDLEWTPDLLSGELRIDSKEGYQWLRSSRRAHIFGELADEPGLISVGSASLASPSAIVCRHEDAGAVRSAAAACGSSELISHDRWAGVPEGWAVLSGYRPAHAAACPLDAGLISLDPGFGVVIRLSGGLQVRPGSFAQCSPPRIEIEPFRAGARVTIDKHSAEIEDGSWRAVGWDAPGNHLVDVVPGPSLTYRIIGDPWADGGWDFWDAHPERFSQAIKAPWAQAQICGAKLLGPSRENVVAAEGMGTVLALGLRRGVTVLRRRPGLPIAIGLLRETPAFLISSSGLRSNQGHIDWLAPSPLGAPSRTLDLQWLAVVRNAVSRRLPLRGATEAGQSAWRLARERARRYRKAVL